MICRELCKTYQNHPVLDHLSLTLDEGGVYALMGASGIGKTTFLHILMGLVTPDEGSVEGISHPVAAVFQEDRLCEFLTAEENAALVLKKPDRAKITQALAELLPPESLHQEVAQFSGGMRRRAAIARAMLFPSAQILMDEPFTGMDDMTKDRTAAFIEKYRGGRTLIFTTHSREDAQRMRAEIITLENGRGK